MQKDRCECFPKGGNTYVSRDAAVLQDTTASTLLGFYHILSLGLAEVSLFSPCRAPSTFP